MHIEKGSVWSCRYNQIPYTDEPEDLLKSRCRLKLYENIIVINFKRVRSMLHAKVIRTNGMISWIHFDDFVAGKLIKIL
jgi:hypothetical protein